MENIIFKSPRQLIQWEKYLKNSVVIRNRQPIMKKRLRYTNSSTDKTTLQYIFVFCSFKYLKKKRHLQ